MSGSVALAAWRRRAGGTPDRRRRRSPATAVVVATSIALGCALVAGRSVAPQASGARPSPATAGPPPCPAVGCDDAVSFADGVLTAGPVHMRVGAAGDQVAVGRWTCGVATVALLRPATGEVFRFDGWATADHSVPAVA